LLVSPIYTSFSKWQFHTCRSRQSLFSAFYLHQQGCPHVTKHSLVRFQASHCLVYVNMVTLLHRAGDCWWNCVFNPTYSNPHNLLLLDWVCDRFWLCMVKCSELDNKLARVQNSFSNFLMGVTNLLILKLVTFSISQWGNLFPRKFLPPD